jgi:serine/threonine-protein kinase
VAVKVFTREMLKRPEDRTRFVREARIAARLSHPSLMRAWDIGSTSDLVFIVLEYVEGETLKARLERVTRESAGTVSWLPVAEAIRVAIAIADGLAFIAANGIAHRDIKPANIQLNEKTVAKILDLGLARPEGISEVTSPLTAPGTPAYISPEQARGDPAVTPKADVYALGLLMYRMLAGALPFEARSADDMLRQHLTAVPQPLADRLKGRASKLPEGLSGLVDSMIRKDPVQRPEAAFVAGALRMYLAKMGEPVPELLPLSVVPMSMPPSNGNNGGASPSGRTGSDRLVPAGRGNGRKDSPSARTTATGRNVQPAMAPAQPASLPSLVARTGDVKPPGPWPFRGWSVALLVAAAGVVVAFVWIGEGRTLEERELKLRDAERKAEQAQDKADRERSATRDFANRVLELARAAEAEAAAGAPQGELNDRLRKAIQLESNRLFHAGDGE